MGEYDPLREFLASRKLAEVRMTFAQIERVLGSPLPNSATEHRPWWANEARGYVHAKAWLDAGYETTQVDMTRKKLIFELVANGVKDSGFPRRHMNKRRFGRALLWVILAITTLAIPSRRTSAEDNGGYSPYVGTWRLSGVPEQLTITLNKLAVTGSIGAQGRASVLITGTVHYENIDLSFDSPDGQRTITLKGVLNGASIRFKRSAAIHAGGSRGDNGIFGARGPDAMTATLVETRGSISGRVVDGASRQPLPNANITIAGLTPRAASVATARSGGQGAFEFKNLPSGEYRVTAALDAYLPFRYGSTDSQGIYQNLGVNAGQQVKGLELRLTRTIAISGRIVDEHGAPVAGAPVVAYVRLNTGGWDRLETATPISKPYIEGSDYRMSNVVRAAADASGRYRLDDMEPGDYYIQAQKPVLFERDISARLSAVAAGNFAAAILPRRCGPAPSIPSRSGGTRQAGDDQVNTNSATEGDTPLFYPEAVDAGRAIVVHAPPGSDVDGVDFVLRPQRLSKVHVSIVRPTTGSPAAENSGAAIALVAAGLRYGSQQPPVWCAEERDGKFQISGVIPGPYKLIGIVEQGVSRMIGIRDIYVESGGADSVTLQLRRGVDVSGQLRMDNLPRSSAPSQLTVRLTPVDSGLLLRVSPGNSDISSAVNADGSFVLHGVIPGVPYRIRYTFPSSGGLNMGLPTALYGGKPIADTLTVENETVRLELSLEPKRDVH